MNLKVTTNQKSVLDTHTQRHASMMLKITSYKMEIITIAEVLPKEQGVLSQPQVPLPGAPAPGTGPPRTLGCECFEVQWSLLSRDSESCGNRDCTLKGKQKVTGSRT